MAQISQCSIRLELLLIIPPQGRVLLILDEIAAAGRQYVDLRAHEAAEGILGRAYDRLATHVEAGVDQDGASGQSVKASDEIVVKWIGFAMHRLHAGGIIDVRNRRDAGTRHVELVDPEQPLLLARHFAAMALVDRSDHEHVGTVHIDVEPLRDVLAQDRRRKRAKALAILDLQIELLLHLRVARIGEDRAIAERARTKLHASLKPADGLAVRERVCGALEQLIARTAGVPGARRL